MTSTGTIRWKSLKLHMDAILPGCEVLEKPHCRRVHFNGMKSTLPRGAHGEANPEIELGHVRSMFRQFGKLAEAKKRIPQLH